MTTQIAHTAPVAIATTTPAPAEISRVSTVALLARARSLRAQAGHVHPVVAGAYLRRAAELRMEAWARAARCGPVEPDDVTGWAA